MKSFAEKKYWKDIYQKDYDWINAISNLKLMQSYYYFALMKILRRYISRDLETVLEVGCAPGNYLVKFAREFQLEPFGVEYAEEGYRATVKNFERYGLPVRNIVLADFFNPEFLGDHQGSYGVVFSAGFIEHFENPRKIIEQQLSLLKKDGILVCLIPNVRYINELFSSQEIIDIHNQEIMSIPAFQELFVGQGEILYCDYFGGPINFGLYKSRGILLKILHLGVYAFQRVFLDTLSKTLFLFFQKDPVNRYASPSLLCVMRRA